MSERFKQLAEQCGIDKLVDSLEYEQFATMIVSECIGILRANSLPDGHTEPRLSIMADEIEKHFGTKE